MAIGNVGCRTKVLKRHGQEIISLLPKVKARSQLLNDVVGSVVAALAMIVAVFGLWLGYRFANFQLDIKFVIITVVIYSIKDRMKVCTPRTRAQFHTLSPSQTSLIGLTPATGLSHVIQDIRTSIISGCLCFCLLESVHRIAWGISY